MDIVEKLHRLAEKVDGYARVFGIFEQTEMGISAENTAASLREVAIRLAAEQAVDEHRELIDAIATSGGCIVDRHEADAVIAGAKLCGYEFVISGKGDYEQYPDDVEIIDITEGEQKRGGLAPTP